MRVLKVLSAVIEVVKTELFGGSSSPIPYADWWNDEAFLNKVCSLLPDQVDWDSINFGSLYACSAGADTFDGRRVVVVALSRENKTSEVLADVELLMKEESLPSNTEIWFYVPPGFQLPPDPRIRRIVVE